MSDVTSVATQPDLSEPLELTTKDVSTYEEKGWLYIPQLIPAELADELRALALVDPPSKSASKAGKGAPPQYEELGRTPRIVSVAKRLLGTATVQQFRTEAHFVVSGRRGGGYLHQDFPYLPFDRAASLYVWIVLGACPQVLGPPEFVNGSHRKYPPLGRRVAGPEEAERIREMLAPDGLERSPNMESGDAIVYDCMTVHRLPPNEGVEPRISNSLIYITPEVLYTGAPYYTSDNLGLTVDQPFSQEIFPLLS